jgi:hypothetical protein
MERGSGSRAVGVVTTKEPLLHKVSIQKYESPPLLVLFMESKISRAYVTALDSEMAYLLEAPAIADLLMPIIFLARAPTIFSGP